MQPHFFILQRISDRNYLVKISAKTREAPCGSYPNAAGAVLQVSCTSAALYWEDEHFYK